MAICIVAMCMSNDTGWRGRIGCLVFTGHFPQKSSIIIGSFAKNDLQVQASYGSTLFLSYTLSHTHIHSQRQSLTHYHDDVSVNHVNVSDHVSVDYDNVSVHK